MNIPNLHKLLSVLLTLFNYVFAVVVVKSEYMNEGDCLEIIEYAKKNDLYLHGNHCIVDENGHLKEFSYDDPYDRITLNDAKTILSYSTLETLSIEATLSKEFIDFLDTLPNLKELTLDNAKYEDDINYEFFKKLETLNFIGYREKKTIPNFTFSLNNLKRLGIDGMKITQEDINKLSSMSNIKGIAFKNERINNLDLSPLNNLNITELTFVNCVYRPLPTFITGFPNLEKLNLESESLSHTTEIGKLSSLKELILNDNYFSKLPEEFSNLVNLKTIELGSNGISEFPKQLLNLKNLENIKLDFNEISSIPSEIGNLVNLQTLILNDNKIEKIPEQLGNAKNLRVLNLNSNELTIIPQFFENFENLEILDLSHNKIFSELPKKFNDFKNLKEIYLNDNVDIKGQILTNESLEECSYDQNYNLCAVKEVKCEQLLTPNDYSPCSNSTIEEKVTTDGKCGKDHGKCPSGQCCGNGKCGTGVDYCYFSNGCDLDYGLCYNECRELKDRFSKHNYEGAISGCEINSEKGYIKYLKIYISDYELTDQDSQTIIDEISKLTNLEYLDIFGSLDGLNIDGLKNLTKLTSLFLVFSELKEIPNFIYSLTSLKKLKVTYSQFTEIPDSISKLTNLEYIDFQSNKIQKIPRVLSKLKNLEYIDLNNNDIYSIIPEELNELPKLKEIYLYDNINIKGKMLTNKSLEKCSYSKNYNICWDKSVNCINYYNQTEYLGYNECTDEYIFSEIESDECEELVREFGKSNIVKCLTNKDGHIETLKLQSTNENVNNAIKKYKDIEELYFDFYSGSLDFNFLKNHTKLTKLYIEYGFAKVDNQIIINSVSLKELIIERSNVSSFSDSIENLKNLEILKCIDCEITTIPEFIGSLNNLKEFSLSGNRIGKIPSTLGNLTNLEILDLSHNLIYGELPESLNNLTKLKEVYLQGNLNVRGKTLTNDSLDTCVYSNDYSICKAKDMKCFTEEDDGIKSCSDVTYPKTDECEQIHDYFINNLSYYSDIVRNCTVNTEGKVVSIKLAYVTDQNYVDNLAKLTHLENLTLYKWGYGTINLDVLKSLKNLVTIHFDRYDNSYEPLVKFPRFVFSLTSLKELTINNNMITDLPSELGTLKNLEKLLLNDNAIDDVIPESLNDLPNLKIIGLNPNKNIRGRTLTNDSLEKCNYGYNREDLCIVKKMACFGKSINHLKFCSSEDNIRCGKFFGSCPSGQCCSMYGYCGTNSHFCSPSFGCQEKYGKCVETRCGEGIGSCSNGQCCSKKGYCGTTSEFCSLSNGCQTKYGKCSTSKKTITVVKKKVVTVIKKVPQNKSLK